MSQTFAGSITTKSQVEKLRLVLSTYQDGLGQLAFEADKSLPGWRDLERSVAFVFSGIAQESKAIFDVLVPISLNPKINYGISCKMRETLQTVQRTRRVTVEVSNSSGKFWNALRDNGIDDYTSAPSTAGKVLIDLVKSWHDEVSLEKGGTVDITRSYYLLLQWDKNSGSYQLFQFPIHLPAPETLSFEANGRRLIGRDDKGVIIEWYGHSGGQLKYYPFVDRAIWLSEVFKLEPLPKRDSGYGVERRVIDFFPELWQAANEM